MKTLKFRPELVKEVLEGRKTSTWRMFDDKNLSVGNMVELLDWESKEKFAEAEILDVQEKKLGEIQDSDFEGHDTYEDCETMLQEYKKYYGDQVTFETPVKMIRFKVIKKF